MNCADVRENLNLYIDNELFDDQAREIKEHLNSCASCMREYRELVEVTELLRGVPDAAVPAGFDDRLKTVVRTEKRKERARTARIRGVGSIAAVFVIGIFSLTMYNYMDIGVKAPGMMDMDHYEASAEPAPAAPRISENAVAKDEREETINNFLSIPDALSGALDNIIMYGADDEYAPPESAAGGASRHLLDLGAELTEKTELLSTRDRIVVDYFFKRISEKLKDFDHEILDFWKDSDGIWNFHVELFTKNEAGEPYSEIYIYAGQDGELWVKESSLSMDTAY